jgi:MYXO-CTERM domain-containing protein
MKTLLLALALTSSFCHAATLLPYSFSYAGIQESNGLHATATGGFTVTAPGDLADLTSFNMTLLETTELFQFTETTFELGLPDVKSFSLDIPANLLTMTVQLSDDPNESPLFANFRVFSGSTLSPNFTGNYAAVGLAVAPFTLTPSPEPATYALAALGLAAVALWRRRGFRTGAE